MSKVYLYTVRATTAEKVQFDKKDTSVKDSGLPQQGILPISARKTITMANRRCLEKDSPHCAMQEKVFKHEQNRSISTWLP